MTTRIALPTVLVGILAAAACSRHEASTVTPRPAEPQRPVAHGESIYDLDLPLEDAHGNTISIDITRGHPTLVSMFYGSCTTACPAIIGYLKGVADAAGPDARVLLVTFDPERDTPARLAELVTKYKLDGRWVLARPTTQDARTLAAVLGVKYRRIRNDEFAHNVVIQAVDADGRTIERIEGLGDSTPLVAALGPQ